MMRRQSFGFYLGVAAAGLLETVLMASVFVVFLCWYHA